jgi:TrmH family RNA methyltransferase
LLRDAQVRRSERAFVLEGPHVVESALARGVPLEALYLGSRADVAFAPLVARAGAAGVVPTRLRDTVIERIATTQTPQPVLAVVRRPDPQPLDALPGEGLVLVAVGISDPGNLGTLLRTAEAAGVAGIVSCGNSVDVFSPKVVRASAGSIFGVSVTEADDPVAVLDALDATRRCYGTAATGGDVYTEVDLVSPVAVLLGNEAHGLPDAVRERVGGWLTVPMAGAVESLNVATTGALIAFEASRQRREAAR